MRWLLIVLIVLAMVACSSPPATERAPLGPAVATLDVPVTLPRIVAHRGASFEAPENTLAAFRRAWALGVECVELDVHLTKDNEVVVMHDDNTKRITGVDRPIAEQTLAEIKQLDAGAWKDARFAGERIPTIGEAIATIPRGRTLFIELKSDVETVPAIARAIRTADAEKHGAHIALQGFGADGLEALGKELPGTPTYWDVEPPMDGDRPLPYPLSIVDEAKRHGFTGLAVLYVSVTDELIEEARGVGLEVDVWTINEREPLAAAQARADLRWIETDRPDLAK